MRIFQSGRWRCCTVLLLLWMQCATPAPAADPALRTLDSHFPFQPPSSLEAWQQQSEQLLRRTKMALGLWPMPTLAEPQPQIYGKVACDGYTVEKIIFESLPGVWVTGNLYRPDPLPAEPMPGVLCPHGHWADARFYDAGDRQARRLIAEGAERFMAAAHNHIQARCVQFARMGCTVIHWDMLGYCDSQQFDFGRMHGNRATENVPPPITDDGWLLLSAPAESHGQSILGLQVLNGLQAARVLRGIPQVDAQRIAITGASGGGTQTFLTAAVDPEIQAAFPAVMVSTGMQGGCTCENACLLRVGQGNIHLAGLIAPRPLGMTAANDWTRTMPEDGFPQLQALYGLYGKKDLVKLKASVHFEHNYNHVARTAVYGWLNDAFKLGNELPVLERDFERLEKAQLTVWDDQHPRPPSGPAFERELLQRWKQNNQAAVDAVVSPEWLRGVVDVLAGVDLQPLEPRAPETIHRSAQVQKRGVVLLARSAEDTRGPIWIEQLNQAGIDVVELVVPSADQQPLVENRRSASFTYGYNLPQAAMRAQELLRVGQWMAAVAEYREVPKGLVASDADVASTVLACGSSESKFDLACLAVNGFRFETLDRYDHPHFVPSAARYGDVPGLCRALSGSGKRLIVIDPRADDWKSLEGAVQVSSTEPADAIRATLTAMDELRKE